MDRLLDSAHLIAWRDLICRELSREVFSVVVRKTLAIVVTHRQATITRPGRPDLAALLLAGVG